MPKYVKVATYPSICDEWYNSVTNGRSSESRTESIRVLPSRFAQHGRILTGESPERTLTAGSA